MHLTFQCRTLFKITNIVQHWSASKFRAGYSVIAATLYSAHPPVKIHWIIMHVLVYSSIKPVYIMLLGERLGVGKVENSPDSTCPVSECSKNSPARHHDAAMATATGAKKNTAAEAAWKQIVLPTDHQAPPCVHPAHGEGLGGLLGGHSAEAYRHIPSLYCRSARPGPHV